MLYKLFFIKSSRDVITIITSRQPDKMVFTKEDKHAITFLRKNKNYGAKHFLKEFADKGWTRGGLNNLLAKIDKTGSFRRQPGSGHPRTA